jgi:hypothetical protein
MDPQLKIALESQTKAFLAEIDKKFATHDAKWESRIDDLERSAASAADQFNDLKSDSHTDVANQLDFFVASSSARAKQVATATATRVAALESATAAFEAWRSGLESVVDEVKQSVESVQAVVAKLAQPWESAPRDPPHPQPGILGAYGSVSACLPAGHQTDDPNGHGFDNHRREAGFGRVFAHSHLPHNGTLQFDTTSFSHLLGSPHHHDDRHSPSGAQLPQLGSLPKMPFPPFDGENPRLWLTQSEYYFDLYNVDPHMWIRVARMNFTGSAAQWLQSIVTRLKFCSWSEFSQMLLERFGRDQHEHLIRQLFRIKQTTTIAAYIEHFSGLVDQLRAYETTTDPLFYTMRFIDGLKDHIKSSVPLQRPSNLDNACALAQLQEEVSELARWEPRKFSSTTTPKPLPSPLPLPRPPLTEEARPRHGNDKLNSLKA